MSPRTLNSAIAASADFSSGAYTMPRNTLNGAAAPSSHRPPARGIQEHTQAQGVTHTTPLIPLQQGRPKIEAPKFEARRRPHPAGLTFAPTSWNRPLLPALEQRRPHLDHANKEGASGRYRGPSLTTSDGPSFLPAYCRQHRNGHPHRRVASTPLNPEQHSNPDEGQRPARPSQPPVSPGGAWPTRGSRGASTNDPLGEIQQ